MRRTLLILLPLLLIIAGFAATRDSGPGDGPLDGDAGGGHDSPIPIGEDFDSFSVGLQNLGKHPITIERVRLVEVAGPIELVGVRARLVPEDGLAGGGGLVSGPPSSAGPTKPLEERKHLPVPQTFDEAGHPDQLLQILFRVRMKAAGIGHSGGVEVTYTSDGKRYQETYPFEMTLCAPQDEYIAEGSTKRCDYRIAPTGKGVLG